MIWLGVEGLPSWFTGSPTASRSLLGTRVVGPRVVAVDRRLVAVVALMGELVKQHHERGTARLSG